MLRRRPPQRPVLGAGTTAPAAPSGIPTDPLGIADAMGRPFTVAFILASVIGVWSVVERLVILRRRRVIPKAFVERFLMHLRAGRMDKNEAIAICHQNQSPMADVFMHGVRKWGRPSVEVEQAVLDGGERQVTQLKKGLRVLNGVSTLSPLIGLLGTVVGMIRSFNDIAIAGAHGPDSNARQRYRARIVDNSRRVADCDSGHGGLSISSRSHRFDRDGNGSPWSGVGQSDFRRSLAGTSRRRGARKAN